MSLTEANQALDTGGGEYDVEFPIDSDFDFLMDPNMAAGIHLSLGDDGSGLFEEPLEIWASVSESQTSSEVYGDDSGRQNTIEDPEQVEGHRHTAGPLTQSGDEQSSIIPLTVESRDKSLAQSGVMDGFAAVLSHLMVAAPIEEQRGLFGLICDKIVKYRSIDQETSAFPPVAFYLILLRNETNFESIKSFAKDCVEWFRGMAPGVANVYIEWIKAHREFIDDSSHGDTRSLIEQSQNPQPKPSLGPEDEPPKKQKCRRPGRQSRVTDHQNTGLRAELERPLETQYRGIVTTSEVAMTMEKEYEYFFCQDVAPAAQDPTWPSTEERRVLYVKEMHDAILDVSNFEERNQALLKWSRLQAKNGTPDAPAESTSARSKKRKRGNDTKVPRYPGLNATDSIFVHPQSTPADMIQAKLLRSAQDCQNGWELRRPWTGENDPKWEAFDTFADRWTAMCHNMRYHKVMLHSALRGDWVNRLSAAPVGERTP
ncbi:hypothetical protein CTRI78_v007907 [Colletotrichum trifolii]|uniref:Uncharacterized protein n=1 Tax=Colletotrichum trifolii TaxID=5466 RepID=A0A4V3HUU6_COLTR|nr:hypothetical protein CTRI78_v007907 [Colletotrichum trifolii]